MGTGNEEENIARYKKCISIGDTAHWERGKLAAEWLELYAGERPQTAYAELVGDEQTNVSAHLRVFTEFKTRVLKVSWSHHREALKECGSADAAIPFLQHAEAEGWSVKQTVDAIRAAKRKEKVEQVEEVGDCEVVGSLDDLIAEGRTFGTIYADPPWQYGNQATRASTNNHYDTMPIAEIKALPIGKLAAEKSHLHLWTTNGFLQEALHLMGVWGFEFKSTFIWVKPQMGIGNYWRNSHEIMLLGVKGGLVFQDHGLMSWLNADRTEHSAKPGQVSRMIELASPGPRLELFSRTKMSGWTVWGNQIAETLIA